MGDSEQGLLPVITDLGDAQGRLLGDQLGLAAGQIGLVGIVLVELGDRVDLRHHIALFDLLAHLDMEFFDLARHLRPHADQVHRVNNAGGNHLLLRDRKSVV